MKYGRLFNAFLAGALTVNTLLQAATGHAWLALLSALAAFLNVAAALRPTFN